MVISFIILCTLYRFVDKENVISVNVLKSSAQKGMKNKIIEQFPHVEAIWSDIVPKKAGIKLVKWYVHFMSHIRSTRIV